MSLYDSALVTVKVMMTLGPESTMTPLLQYTGQRAERQPPKQIASPLRMSSKLMYMPECCIAGQKSTGIIPYRSFLSARRRV